MPIQVMGLAATMNAMELKTLGKENPGCRLSLPRLLTRHGQAQLVETAGLTSGETEQIMVDLVGGWSQILMFQTMELEVTEPGTGMAITRVFHTRLAGETTGISPQEGEAEVQTLGMAGRAWIERYTVGNSLWTRLKCYVASIIGWHRVWNLLWLLAGLRIIKKLILEDPNR